MSTPSDTPPKKRNDSCAAVLAYTRMTDLIFGWSGATPARTNPYGVGRASKTSTANPAFSSASAA